MTTYKKLISSASLMAMLFAPALKADECATNSRYTGCAYDDSCCTPSMAPALAIGALALAAVVAIVCMDRSGGKSHGSTTIGTILTHSHS